MRLQEAERRRLEGQGAQHPFGVAEGARCRLAQQVVGRAGPEGAGVRGPRSEAQGPDDGSQRFLVTFCRV
jgi:hypothetical protein